MLNNAESKIQSIQCRTEKLAFKMQDAEHRILDVTHSLVKTLHLVLTVLGTIYLKYCRGPVVRIGK